MSKKKEEIEMQTPVVQEAAELPAELAGTWGAAENLDSNDLVIAKIYHMQGTSALVVAEKAQPGDWCHSITEEVLVKKEKHLSLIIFDSYKNIIVSTKGKNDKKWKFKEYIDATPENVLLPWEEVDANDPFGGSIKRNLQYNYFCIIADRPAELPFVISLSSTKVKVAKKLNTMLATLSQVLKKPSAAYIFNFLSVKESNDENTWYSAEISQGPATPNELLAVAKHWYDKLKTTKVVVREAPEEHAAEDSAVNTVMGDDDIAY